LPGGLGLFARSKIAKERKESAGPAVAKLLASGMGEVDAAALAAVATEYGAPTWSKRPPPPTSKYPSSAPPAPTRGSYASPGRLAALEASPHPAGEAGPLGPRACRRLCRAGVEKKEFKAQLIELYGVFLGACLDSSQVVPSELGEIKKLGGLLSLSRADVGSAFHTAGRRLYSRHRAYLEETEPNDSKVLLNKFVFLAERVLSQDESEEGYRYEAMRAQKVFQLSKADWASRAETVALPFYEKVLDKVVAGQQAVTAEQLSRIRADFGVSDDRAKDMHAVTYEQVARGALAPERGAAATVDAAAQAKLAETRALLELSEEATYAALLAIASPLFSATMSATLAEAEAAEAMDEASAARLSGSIAQRASELQLSAESAKALQAEAVRAAAGAKLSEAVTFLRAQNVPQVVMLVEELVSYCGRMTSLMAATGAVDGADAAATGQLVGSLGANLGCKESEVTSLYRLLLLSYLEGQPKVDEERQASLLRLRQILGLTESEALAIFQTAAGPLFKKTVKDMVKAGAELGAAEKDKMDKSLTDLGLPRSVTAQISADVYAERLGEIAAETKILDEAQGAQLAAMRTFLGLELGEAPVAKAHEEAFGETYGDSCKQVLGVSGSIPDEYFDGLDRLRERLGLSELAAKKQYAIVGAAKLKEYGDNLQKTLEAQQKAAQKKESLPMGQSLISEVLGLVEYATASRLLTSEGGADVSAATLAGQFSSSVIKELYRQALLEAFSGSESAQNEQLFSTLGPVAAVFGLDAEDVSEIHTEIGKLIFEQYLRKSLKQAGGLAEKDEQFLAQITSVLSLDAAKMDLVVREQKLEFVDKQCSKIFSDQTVEPAEVTKLRDMAALYEVDLVEDLEVNRFRLEKMFAVELESLIDAGDLAQGDTSVLEEVCEGLKVSEEKAAEILEATVQKKAASGILQAATLMQASRAEEMMEELEKLLSFATLIPGVVATPAVKPQQKQEMFMLFQASALGDGDMSAGTKDKATNLQRIFGMPTAA